MPSRQRSRRIRRSGVAGRCAASGCKHRKHSRRGNGRWNGKRDEVKPLAIAVGAASSSRLSSPVSGWVSPGHAVTAASPSGRVSRRSSPSAAALTGSLHRGLAVRLPEVKSGTAVAVALGDAPLRSSWSWSSSAAGALAATLAPVQHSATAACGWAEGRLSRRVDTRPQRSALVGRRATGKTCRGWQSRSAQRADRLDRRQCRLGDAWPFRRGGTDVRRDVQGARRHRRRR